MNKRILNKIMKVCGTPEDFCFDNVSGESMATGLRNIRGYVRRANRVERKIKEKYL